MQKINQLFVLLAFMSMLEAQIQKIGKCSRDIPTYEKVHQKKLDINKLQGYWMSVYDIQDDEETQGHTCPTIQFNTGFNTTNATIVELLQGSKCPKDTEFKIVDPASGNPIEIKESRMLYDDSVLLIFNHPTDSSLSTIQPKNAKSKEETKAEYLAQYEMAPLSPEDKVMLTDEQLREYESDKAKVQELSERVMQLVDEYDPYDSGMVIVDTDYENYLLTYNCQEEFSYEFDVEESHLDYEIIKEAEAFNELMNHTHEFHRFQEDLQSRVYPDINLEQEIEELKSLDPEKFKAHFKDGLTTDDWQELRKYYQLSDHIQKFQITLYARDPEKAVKEKSLQMVKDHFPRHDFATHEPIDHSGCPTGDIFTSENAMTYEQVEKEENQYLDRAEEIYGTEEEYDETMDEDVDMDEVQRVVDEMMNNALKEDL